MLRYWQQDTRGRTEENRGTLTFTTISRRLQASAATQLKLGRAGPGSTQTEDKFRDPAKKWS
uniref:Uncharacterized protein n=1 Tax=Anguilla anguilla TaxID=7936 RepID=A0A0E9U7R2_ANGAN